MDKKKSIVGGAKKNMRHKNFNENAQVRRANSLPEKRRLLDSAARPRERIRSDPGIVRQNQEGLNDLVNEVREADARYNHSTPRSGRNAARPVSPGLSPIRARNREEDIIFEILLAEANDIMNMHLDNDFPLNATDDGYRTLTEEDRLDLEGNHVINDANNLQNINIGDYDLNEDEEDDDEDESDESEADSDYSTEDEFIDEEDSFDDVSDESDERPIIGYRRNSFGEDVPIYENPPEARILEYENIDEYHRLLEGEFLPTPSYASSIESSFHQPDSSSSVLRNLYSQNGSFAFENPVEDFDEIFPLNEVRRELFPIDKTPTPPRVFDANTRRKLFALSKKSSSDLSFESAKDHFSTPECGGPLGTPSNRPLRKRRLVFLEKENIPYIPPSIRPLPSLPSPPSLSFERKDSGEYEEIDDQ